MNYTLHQLRVFYEVTQYRSITRAAEALHLSQPAVSIQLRNFQRQFDAPLTELVNRRLYITDLGREVAELARQILDNAELLEHRASTKGEELTGRLTISVVSTGKYVMPYFLRPFLAQHPRVRLSLDVTNRQRVVESLRANEVDFSLVSILPERLSLHSLTLLPNILFLVGHPEVDCGPNADLSTVLEQRPLIFREVGSGTRQVTEQYLYQRGLPLSPQLELVSNEAVKQAVMAGLGVSIMPLIGIRNELELGQLSILPVPGLPVRTEWQITWLQDKTLSPTAAAFLEYLRLRGEEIVAQSFAYLAAYPPE